MNELFAGIAGGLGLFIAGMWLLTENLQTLSSRRLRRSASRWTTNRFSALLWGVLAGGTTQSMTALTFIVVSILRSGLIATRGALALILGGCVGASFLVVIVTFDIKIVALYVLGLSGTVIASERLSRYRPIAASFLGGAMLVLGLLLLKDAAAPLAQQPWFRDMLEGTGNSLVLAFLVAALLTAILQSANAVCVFGISLATVGVISVDQAIMVIYGTCLGSSAILYLLSAGLTGRSRQVAMYMVLYDALACGVLVPLLYCELQFEIPLMKALVLAVDLDMDQQLALVYVLISVLPLPVMLVGLGWSASLLERLWPTTTTKARRSWARGPAPGRAEQRPSSVWRRSNRPTAAPDECARATSTAERSASSTSTKTAPCCRITRPIRAPSPSSAKAPRRAGTSTGSPKPTPTRCDWKPPPTWGAHARRRPRSRSAEASTPKGACATRSRSATTSKSTKSARASDGTPVSEARSVGAPEARVQAYYADTTQRLYIGSWHREHFHFGLCEPGEPPKRAPSSPTTPGLQRALEHWNDVTVAPAAIAPEHHVVDAGCGVGGTREAGTHVPEFAPDDFVDRLSGV